MTDNIEFDPDSISSEPFPKKKKRMDESTKKLITKSVSIFSSIVIVFSLLSIAVVPISSKLGVTFVSVHGTSMEPTFSNGESVPIMKEDLPKKGNLIVTKTPDSWVDNGYIADSNLLLKRIVGLPGDEIEITDKALMVNGELVHELSQLAMPCEVSPASVTIPEDKIFIMGDNRLSSFDSYAAWCMNDPDMEFLINKDDLVVQGHKWPFWIS